MRFKKMIFVLVTVSLANIVIATPQWPMFQYNRQRTGFSPFAGPQSPDTAWTYSGNASWNYSAPVIGEDGTIYYAPYQDSLCAINLDGVLKWKYQRGSNNQTPALDAQGRIYIIGSGMKLYCLEDSVTYPKLIWMSDSSVTPNGTGHTLVTNNGYLYTGQVTSYYAGGQFRWCTPAPPVAEACPGVAMSLDERTLYTHWATDPWTEYIRALDTSGQVQWNQSLGEFLLFGLPSVGQDSTIYVMAKRSSAPRLIALNPNGTEKWHKDTLFGYGVYSTPTIGIGETLYIPLGNGLSAVSPSGSIIWHYPTSGVVFMSAVQDPDGTIYFGDSSGYVYALYQNGSLKWSVQFREVRRSFVGGSSIDQNHRLIIPSSAGLYVLGQNVFKDIALQRIITLSDSADSGSVVNVQAVVKNNSAFTVVWMPLQLKIGSLFLNIDTIPFLKPGDSTTFTFAPCTLRQRGWNVVVCSTAAPRDQNSANDFKKDSIFVRVRDVGATTILAPTGVIDSNTVVTPQARVKNFGNVSASFPVSLRVGSFYNRSQNVNDLSPGDSMIISFAPCTLLLRGTHNTKCTTAMTGDQYQLNDVATGSVTVRIADVGVTQIVTPVGTIDSTGPIIPQARVRNYGNLTEIFNVTLKIGTSYTQTRPKTLGAGIEDTVYFPAWVPTRGTHTTRCSTNLVGDVYRTNDTLSGSLTVQVKDVGVTQIVAPSGTIDSTGPIIPQARARNYGTNTETFNITFRIIGTSYSQARTKTLNQGIEDTVNFPAWVPTRGTFATRCSTYLVYDVNRINDTLSGSVTVQVKDVGVTQIVTPSGIIDSTGQIIPQARVRNNGTNTETFDVTFRIIGTLYSQIRTKTLGVGLEDTVNFPAWTPVRGSYTTRCSTYLAGDVNKINDTLSGSFTVRVRDIGVTQIVTPSGIIDSTGPIIPQVRVRNYGTNTETFDVTFRIGISYIQTRSKTLNAGIEDTVNFLAWTPVRGTFATRCSTYLVNDVNRINDTLSGSVTVQVKDVGVTQIVTPSGIIDSTGPITPQVRVRNYGSNTETFNVTFRIIGTSYNQTRAKTLGAGIEDTVNFSAWIPIRGTYTTCCSTYLVNDVNRSNDTLSGSVTVQVKDIGVTQIVAPSGIMDSTGQIIPQARVRNYGTNTETFDVTFRIGTGYIQTRAKTLNAGIEDTVNFPAWIPVRGSYPTRCSTYLVDDVNQVNDTLTGSVTIQVKDIGVTQIVTPSGTIDSLIPVIPQARVINYGTNTETFNVTFKIGTSYTQSRAKTIAAGIEDTVNFPAWIPVRGSYATRCSTYLIDDINRTNDTISGSVMVLVSDVGVVEIIAPVGSIASGTEVIPKAKIANFGIITETFPVYFRIISTTDTVYYGDTLVTIEAHRDSVIDFASWIATPGSHKTFVRTNLIGDQIPENDTTSNSFTVAEVGWQRMADILLQPSGKNPKSGSDITTLAGKIYLLKASNTADFYSFTPNQTNGTWTILDSVPLGTKETGDGKKPKKGAALAGYLDKIYMLRGNNTLGFWVYTISGDSTGWRKLKNITAGEKKSKGGAKLVCVNKNGLDCIFAMKGSKTAEFYLYFMNGDSWSQIANPSPGTSGKIGYKDGSCLTYNEDSMLYVLKGNYGDFFKYNVITNTWSELRRMDPTVFLNRDNKKKKVKDGAGLVYLNNSIFLMKGGNTNEFWKYDVGNNNWVQMNPAEIWDIPIGIGKKVKGGGALCVLGGCFYALKGNNTPEFYKHSPPSITVAMNSSFSEGAMGKEHKADKFELSITPNPTNNLITIKYNLPKIKALDLKLYDICGSVVKSYTNSSPTKTDLILVDMGELPTGVYILRFNSGDIKITRKLILEK